MKQFKVVNKSEGYSIKNFTTEQKAREFATLRYAICVDFECMNDQGYTKEEALAWFKTEECTEAYDGTIIDGIYKPTGENFMDVVEEVYHGMEHGNDAMDWFIKTL